MLAIIIISIALILVIFVIEKIRKYLSPIATIIFLNSLIANTFINPLQAIVSTYHDVSFNSKEEFYETMQDILYKEVNLLANNIFAYKENKSLIDKIDLWPIVVNILQILIYMVAIQKTEIISYPFKIDIFKRNQNE